MTPNDAYAIGWSPTRLVGSACGAGRAPASAANVYHFLKVSVSGTSVTVTPTDSLGNTFDVQTFTFAVPPDTYLDSTPPAGTASRSATFAFHSTDSPATFTCRLDGGGGRRPARARSPTPDSRSRAHTFSVSSTVRVHGRHTCHLHVDRRLDASVGTPTAFTAAAASPFEVDLSWTAATDNVGVTGYDLFRDDQLYRSLGPVASFVDTDLVGSSTHTYAVRARDVAGNVSAFTATVPVTTPPPPVPGLRRRVRARDAVPWSAHRGTRPSRAPRCTAARRPSREARRPEARTPR